VQVNVGMQEKPPAGQSSESSEKGENFSKPSGAEKEGRAVKEGWIINGVLKESLEGKGRHLFWEKRFLRRRSRRSC